MILLSAYERFRHTVFNLNISSWTCDDVEYLCRQVLLHQSYNLKMNMHFYKPSENYCSSKRVPVKLTLRDAEWLPRKKMLARKCPPVMGYAFQFYVFGGMGANTVVFYVRYSFQKFAFPDSVVIRVNEIYEEGYKELVADDYAVAEFEEDIDE